MRQTAKKVIFEDRTGKRWQKFQSFFYYFSAFIILILAVSFSAVWTQPQELLEKKGDDDNFDVVDDISMQIKDKIAIEGEGTLVSISPNDDPSYGKYDLIKSGASSDRKVVLTFDDGPNPLYTTAILDILKKEAIPATFFLVGDNIAKHPEVARRVVNEGMEVGNHTFTHQDRDYADYGRHTGESGMNFEINFTQNLIQAVSGQKTRLFRAPFWGSENDIDLNTLGLTTFALDKGYMISAPTKDSNDWQGLSPEKITTNSTLFADGTVVLLLHDGGGYRQNTVLALPAIIKYYREHGYTFTTMAGLTGQAMMSDNSLWEDISSNLAFLTYRLKSAFPRGLTPIFITGLIFSLLYSSVTVFLALVEIWRYRRVLRRLRPNYHPQVSVIIPAFNEDQVIGSTIRSILASHYQNLIIYVVDDGSTDDTLGVARRFARNPRVKILTKLNGGKHSALNLALGQIKTRIFISMDADTQVLPDTIGNLVRYFQNPKVAAVGGNIKVGNRRSFLGIMQSIEYTLSLNLERNAYSLFNSILVVPGALGAWRTSAVRRVGGYSAKTLTEDAELTLRILKRGYKIYYEKHALAYTETPQTHSQLIRQRFRWYFGVLQTFYLHRDMLFGSKHHVLGKVVLPFTIFIQIPMLILTPVMDVLALAYLLEVSVETVGYYLAIYLVIRAFLASFAYLLSHENPWPVLFIPLIRFVYQPILYVSLYAALYKIIKGELVVWRKLRRYNSVVLKKAVDEAAVHSLDG